MKNKNIDEIIRQKLMNVNHTSNSDEVEKIHQYVTANQPWWIKNSWVKSVGYIAAASVLVASLTFNFILLHKNNELQNSITNIDPKIEQLKVEKSIEKQNFHNIELNSVDHNNKVDDNKNTLNIVENQKIRQSDNNRNTINNEEKNRDVINNEKHINQIINQKSNQSSKYNLFNSENNLVFKDSKSTLSNKDESKKLITNLDKSINSINIELNGTIDQNDNKILKSNEANMIGEGKIELAETNKNVKLEELDALDPKTTKPLVINNKTIEDLEYYVPSPYKIKPIKHHSHNIRAGVLYIGDKISNTYGVSGEYIWRNNWGISTGFQSRVQKLMVFRSNDQFKMESGKDFHETFPKHEPGGGPGGPKIKDIQFRECKFEIPLNISYYYHLNKDQSLFASIGTKINLGLRKDANFSFDIPNPIDEVMKIKEYENKVTFNNFNIGVGYEVGFKRFSWQIMPVVEFTNAELRKFETPAKMGIQTKLFYIF